jgi:hypothetical protein
VVLVDLEEQVVVVMVEQEFCWYKGRNSKYWRWRWFWEEVHFCIRCRWKRSCYIKYASCKFSGTTTGSPTESDHGTTKVLIFNGDGSYTA